MKAAVENPIAPTLLSPARFADVAVPVPLRHTFTYEIPEALAPAIRPGAMVRVPFGRRKLSGFVMETADTTAVEGVKPILAVENEELSLPSDLVSLCRWVAEYYLAPIGEVCRAALPAGLGKKRSRPWLLLQ